MRWIPDLGRFLRTLVHGEDVRGDLEDEIRHHVERRAEQLQRDGLPPDRARREARRRLGNLERIRRECRMIDEQRIRERRRADRFDTVKKDLLHTLRMLRRHRVFAGAALLTLAFGIGANTAVFSVLRGVVLRPLPFAEPDRLAAVWLEFRGDDGGPGREIPASEPEYLEFREATRAFTDVAAYWTGQVNLGGLDDPIRVPAASVSANFLAVLGVAPMVGRGFATGEDRPGAQRVVVLGHGLWRRAFDGDAAVVGRSILVNGRPATVIGVMPASFRFPDGTAQVLRTNVINPEEPAGRASHYLSMIGRLAPKTTLEAARSEIRTLVARWNRAFPDRHGPSRDHPIVTAGLHERIVGDVRARLWILTGAVGVVLLIACVNVTNLMLARAETRHREFAVRTALGAGRRRLLVQLLTESGVIAVLGGVMALGLAAAGLRVFLAWAPADLPRLDAVRLDGAVLAFTALVAVLSGLAAGILPAITASARDPRGSLTDDAPGVTTAPRRMLLRRLLVAGEVALATVLLIGAGLLVKGFVRLQNVDPGFRPAGVVTMQFALNTAAYPEASDVARLHAELNERVQALPGVASAGAVRALPLGDNPPGHETLWLSGASGGNEWEGGRYWVAQYQVASPGYFRALGIPLHTGRTFTTADRADAQPVAVVNETMAEQFWPGRDPIGERVQLGIRVPQNENPEMTIVGVVGDVLQSGLDGEPEPQVFVPRQQAGAIYNGLGTRFASYVVRAETPPPAAMRAVRAVIRELDPQLPVARTQTMHRVVAQSVADARFTSAAMGVFAAVALVLGAVGIYGLIAYAVARRTREIGLRVALGADRHRVQLLVVRQSLTLTVVGLAAGVAGALGLGRVLEGMVFDLSVRDPAILVGAPLALLAAALAAAYLPARRIARVDPVVAMRTE